VTQIASMQPGSRVLVIEDDPGVAGSLKKALEAEGHEVAIARRGDEGLAVARQMPFDIVIAALKMPGLSGLDLVDQLHAARPNLPIILMTAYGTTDSAIDAARLGAYEYVLKPFEMSELLDIVTKALASVRPASGLMEPGIADSNPLGMIGRSRAMQSLYKEIGQAGRVAMNVLIRGETGTGKDLVARAIHQHSSRAAQPFVAVNCTAIPESLAESELFGHERGAFTGANARRLGHFEQAGAGTLFLDEIGDLPPGTQAKLLRVLQVKCVRRLGGNEVIRVDARVLAATNRDLETALKENRLREDLFYRLSALSIRVPPLREHLEDIPDLVRHCLSRFSAEAGVATPSMDVQAVDFLARQPWPGNVRELENVVQHALLLARNYPIGLAHVQEAHASAGGPPALPSQTMAHYFADLIAKARQGKIAGARAVMIEDMERELFAQAIQLAQGNQARAARWVGVTRKTLRQKLRHFGLHAPTPGPITGSG
jgi:DNA-binding NtrC family response regulator